MCSPLTRALLLTVTIVSIRIFDTGALAQTPLEEARKLIAEHEQTIRPLEIAFARAAWDADATGTGNAFAIKEQAQNRLDEALSDPARFARLKSAREKLSRAPAGQPLVSRQLDLLYLGYLGKQLDPSLLRQIAARESAIGKAFNTSRAQVNGKELTDSEVREILRTSRDLEYRKAVWEASKAVGSIVESDLKELVGLRNQAACKLGFKNFHVMSLYLNEQDQREVRRLFDDLDKLVRKPFKAAKAQIDQDLAKHFGTSVADLRPWHYQDLFFQEAPANGTAELSQAYAGADIVRLSRDYFAGIGLDVSAVLARSDLFERQGKYPHAQCADVDRQGDVRVMANIVPNEYWAGTMLHELGHAVYASTYIPAELPYLLRAPAHTLTTEGMAMLFEKEALKPAWITAMGLSLRDAKRAEAQSAEALRQQLLIFAAWSQVMFRFEMALYDNPRQNLNNLWWDLVERYQGIRRPGNRNAPDYAAKIHIAQVPAYYHNYLMGQLFASQLHHAIAREVFKTADTPLTYVGRKEVGDFLKSRVFAPGASLPWQQMIESATGEKLNPKAFAADLTSRPEPR